jgi:hypothetical protein
MRIIENCIPKDYQEEIYKEFTSHDFGWYFDPATVYTKADKPIKDHFTNKICITPQTQDSPQFTHTFYWYGDVVSKYMYLMQPMFFHLQKHGINAKLLKRIKANHMTREHDYPKDFYNVSHIDAPPEELPSNGKVKTFLYYVNDSDGDTFIFNEKLNSKTDLSPDNLTLHSRVTPKAGSGVLFDSYHYHASSHPVNSKRRMVINFIFETE